MKLELNFWPIFHQDTKTHISDHIQEWRQRKRLIKAKILPEFHLKWFLKSLQPEISKDVSLSSISSEEKAIFQAQQLELIYSQFGTLQKILPDAPRSKFDLAKPKPSPHADGIVGSVDANMVNLLNHLRNCPYKLLLLTRLHYLVLCLPNLLPLTSSKLLIPKEINNPMGRGKDEVRRKTRKGREM